ncbi:hypothetical protein B0H16DRAFT_1779751 [Mycena metata]|uniref:MYND-type domain-containing protein n=1 Tax=Mycena metata TaxID=1033252 RepID=A0AAD7HSC5_9AGAR|nr:hypothetical protein B0H16DRAFT_1779751 [Mycena metata]
MGKKNKSKNTQAPQADSSESDSPTEPDSDVSIERLLVVAHLSYGEQTLVEDVSRLLCIPDYNTARGLKQCHQDFGTISSKLEQVFTQTRGRVDSPSADKLTAAVITIYRDMCADKILRTRIVAEADFLNKAISVLNHTFAGRIALSALSNISHVDDVGIRENILPIASAILDTAEKQLHDIEYVENAVCVLKHSITFILDDWADPKLARLVPFPRVIQFFLSAARLPTSTDSIFDHFLDFCPLAIKYYPTVFSSIPDVVDFLVACTRAKDLCTRSAALRSLTRLWPPQNTAPETALESSRVSQALAEYAAGRTSQAREVEERRKLRDVLVSICNYTQGPFSEIGYELADLILNNELGVRTYFVCPSRIHDDLVLHIKGERMCFPPSVLPLAAKAVRSSSGAHAELKGDILELEFLLTGQNSRETFTFAQSCIERHPSTAFFYYVLAMLWSASADIVAQRWGANVITSMRHAERGLQCPDLTDFLREELLYYAASSADLLAAQMLTGNRSDIRVQEILALMQKAIHLAFLMKGHTLNDKCAELQILRDKLLLSYDIARCSVRGFFPTQQCLMIDKILPRMSTASRAWKDVVSRLPSREYPSIDPNVDLAAWLEKLDVSDPHTNFFTIRGIDINTKTHGGVLGSVQLHRCSKCTGASAVLKRCGRCQEARYCNSECQRRHWEVHRKTCKGSKSAEA